MAREVAVVTLWGATYEFGCGQQSASESDVVVNACVHGHMVAEVDN